MKFIKKLRKWAYETGWSNINPAWETYPTFHLLDQKAILLEQLQIKLEDGELLYKAMNRGISYISIDLRKIVENTCHLFSDSETLQDLIDEIVKDMNEEFFKKRRSGFRLTGQYVDGSLYDNFGYNITINLRYHEKFEREGL